MSDSGPRYRDPHIIKTVRTFSDFERVCGRMERPEAGQEESRAGIPRIQHVMMSLIGRS